MAGEEERLDAITGLVLLVGAAVGILAMAVGAGLWMAGRPSEMPQPHSVQTVFQGAAELDPIDLMDMGILLLMATPVARVVTLVVGFLWMRRFRFALVSALVLGLLFVSFLFAAGR